MHFAAWLQKKMAGLAVRGVANPLDGTRVHLTAAFRRQHAAGKVASALLTSHHQAYAPRQECGVWALGGGQQQQQAGFLVRLKAVVKGVKGRPPIFTNRIESQKNSLLS